MRICHVGINHKTAPIELREQLAVSEREIPKLLQELAHNGSIREIAILSTCNRVEFTSVTHDPDTAMAVLHEWFASRAGLPLDVMRQHLYSFTGEEAVLHLYAVASGLDSLVLGEPQILGQVKSAYELALTAGTAGLVLHRLFQSTFAAAKRARSETAIGREAVNIASCAVDLARHIFGDFTGKTVLIIGAGEMAELAARHLRGKGVAEILVANRTLERAKQLARQFNGHAFVLHDLPEYLDAADIVISSTGSSTYVLLPSMMQKAMAKRQGRPVFLVDIAVPRDIDPRVGDLEGVYLYDIDDLQQVVQGNREQRMKEAQRARRLLEEDAKSFFAWLKSLESVPIIRALQERMEALRQEELSKAKRYFKGLDEAQMQALDHFSRALMKRLMHPTLTALKRLPEDMEGDLLMGAARILFDLDSKGDRKEGHGTKA